MTHPPKVLHVLAPAHEGGLERVVSMLSARQVADGVHVAAVVEPGQEDTHPFVLRLRALGVPVTALAVRGREYVREYRALRELIGHLRPAVVHTHGYRSDVLGTTAARRSGVPSVSTAHGFTGGSLRNRINERVQCLALRYSSAVIAVAAPIVPRLAAAGVAESRIFCVPNGFVPDGSRLSRAEARDRLGIDPTRVVAGWVGRLSQEKGADVMLRALSESDPRWQLSVIGDGAERESLQKLARELGVESRVQWHGPLPRAATLFAAFDAFVLSSRTEGTPIALFEAMDASVPIIAARVGGVPEVVSSDHAILVGADQPSAIAAALHELTADSVGARERASRARQRLLSDFGEAAWTSAIDSVYRFAMAAMC